MSKSQVGSTCPSVHVITPSSTSCSTSARPFTYSRSSTTSLFRVRNAAFTGLQRILLRYVQIMIFLQRLVTTVPRPLSLGEGHGDPGHYRSLFDANYFGMLDRQRGIYLSIPSGLAPE